MCPDADPPLPEGGPPVDEGAPRSRTVRLVGPYDLRRSLGVLCHGRRDPTARLDGRTLWRATHTPAGAAAEAVVADPGGTSVTAYAWGPGADWLLEHLPDLIGAPTHDFDRLVTADPGPDRPIGWDAVAAMARRRTGIRIPRSRAVVEACVPTVLEQKVTGLEAKRSYRELVVALGAPGPAGVRGLRLPPTPVALATAPSWAMHRFGIERKRADTIRRVGASARRLEEAVGMTPVDARRRLTALPGLGPWSVAEIGLVALGDADAVSVGDFHLPNQVAWALAGIARGDDRLMLELLEPWRGHRGRVLRLLVAEGITAPRFGPRMPVRSFRGY
jgi:3-methyladenine DNA glycosylase/8-oxoguanine DNA glycosylase